MLTLDEIRKRLQDRSIPYVAAQTGLSYNTIRDIRNKADANPTYNVLSALNSYFERAKDVAK
jgi:hypothetical protein